MKTKRIVFSILSGIFLLLFVGTLIGGYYANIYSNIINMFFGCKMHEVVSNGDGSIDTEYWKSAFMTEDGEYDEEALWDYDLDVARRVAEEGAVLMWNEGGLPLEAESSVSFFGTGSVNYYYVMGGSASVDVLDAATLRTAMEDKGFSINKTLWSYYANSNYKGVRCQRINEAPWSEVDSKCHDSYSRYGDNAIMVISRAGMEHYDLYMTGSDGIDGSYLDLSQNEVDALRNIISLKNNGVFANVVLLINSDHAISFKHLQEFMSDIDACLWVGSGGRSAAPAVANILNGEVTPSGRLVDTWVNDNFSAPSSINFGDYTYGNSKNYSLDTSNNEDNYIVYQEGMYVGYRYYETRYEDSILDNAGVQNSGANSSVGVKYSDNGWNYDEEVAFPFGYGTSYTQFSYEKFSCDEKRDSYEVSVTVKNVGETYSGKESVLVYLQKPYTAYDKANGLEKSAIELVGFAKTETLAPGESQEVTISISKSSLKTYDNNNQCTYILEAGDYYLSVGDSAHDVLNNVLTAKGVGDYGDDTFVKQITVSKDDYETYSKSEYTDAEITNLFDSVDINKYEYSGNNTVTYLSRSNWEGTYPTAKVEMSLNDDMVEDMRQHKTPEEDERYADMEFTYGADNGLSLVMLKDYEYDNEYWDQLLDQMTLEEMITLCVRGSMSTQAITSVGCPATQDCDGPLGLTKFYAPGAIAGGMCYPSEVLMGATFNAPLIEEMGTSYGENMLQNGFEVLYAPGVNIHRNAYSARNGEYYSEDPVLNGIMGAAVIRGARSKGAAMTLKHFVLNDQDFNRNNCGVWCNEQTMREVYLKAFEIAVTESDTLSVMSSYNRIGVRWTGASKALLTDLLRGEWGFVGFVISDAWPNYAAYSYIDGLMAGNDLEFTSGTIDSLIKYADSPTVQYKLRESCHRILYGICKTSAMNGLDADSIIIPVTNWWQYAIVGVQVGFGALTVLWIVLLGLTFIKKEKNNRK